MTTNTLHITVESTAAFFEAALDDVRQLEADEDLEDESVLSLPDEEALERVLSEKNLELIRTIATEEPASVRELARLVDRDIKNVSTALNRLAELGLVDLEDEGRAKRPTVWYDHIEIDIQVTPDETDDSDVALV
ncbi:MarR family transcriptional regulator [Halosimplex halobium]|uniref:HVO_A0114 family putative DNA-binding protein n=1 Tax=Halosimplex halobium TaxID=3396618 RepID=UPI003F56DB79